MTDHRHIIDALGGGSRVAKALASATGVKPDVEAVYKWKRRGIPFAWRVHIDRLARSEGVEVPSDFFDPPKGHS